MYEHHARVYINSDSNDFDAFFPIHFCVIFQIIHLYFDDFTAVTSVNIYVADSANAKINTCDYYSTTTCYQELKYLDCAEFDAFLVERASRNLQSAVGGWVVQLLVTQMRQIEQMPKPINTHDSTTCSHLLLEYT